MLRPLSGLVMVSALGLVVPGCKSDPPTEVKPSAPVVEDSAGSADSPDSGSKADGEATGGSGSDAPKVTPPQPPGGSGPMALTPAQRLNTKGVAVMGQVVLANPHGLLEKLAEVEALAEAKSMLDPNAVKAFMTMGAAEQSDLVNLIDLKGPIGCVLFEAPLPRLAESVACTARIEGGGKALMSALGPDVGTPGHSAMLTVSGQNIWIDALGDHMVVTTGEPVFKRSQGYIQANMIDRAPALGTSVEFVVRAEPLENLQDAAGLSATNPLENTPKTGDPLLDGLVRMGAKFQDQQSSQMQELESFAFAFDLVDGLPVVDVTAHSQPGSEMAAYYAKLATKRVSAAKLATLPPDPVGFFATTMTSASLPSGQKAQQKEVARAWAAEAGLDSAKVEQAVIDAMQGYMTRAGDYASLSLHKRSHGSPGLTYVLELAPGTKHRDAYVESAKKLKPTDVFGSMSGTIEWTFTPGVLELGGVPVDRLEIGLTKEAIGRIKAGDAKKVLEQFPAIIVDRVEVDGWVVVQIDVRPDLAGLKAALDRVRNRPPTATGVPATLVANAEKVQVLAGVSVAGVAGIANQPLPGGYKGGLDDVTMLSNITADAVVARFSTSKAALNAAADAAK